MASFVPLLVRHKVGKTLKTLKGSQTLLRTAVSGEFPLSFNLKK